MKSIIFRRFGQAAKIIPPIFVLLFSVHTGLAQETEGKSALPQVQIPGTQLRSITSGIVGQEYDLHIHLPRFYEDTTRTFPVIFVLDAQWDFTLVTAIYGQQYYDGFIPGAVIVGITWGGKEPSHGSLRARDFTPSNSPQIPESGNAPKFLAFIKNELIPFVASQYRVNEDRTLMGSSFGGLFTLYALFQEPGLFKRYVLTSPAIMWDGGLIYRHEKAFRQKQSKLSARVFMAVGDLEHVAGFQKFADHLKAQNYDDLMLETRVLGNTGHSGSKTEGYTRGLQYVFARPPLTLSPEILQQYVGEYQDEVAGFRIQITQENGHLIVGTPENDRVRLLAETNTDFYLKGVHLFARFKKDGSGQVTGINLQQFNGTNFLKKM